MTGPAVEEIVRVASPVTFMRRTVTHDLTLSGHDLSEGDRMILFYGAANRDPRVFDDPETFDVRRDPNPHVGFGGPGPHFCLGAHLARREVAVVFRQLLTRFPDIEVDRRPGAAPGPGHPAGRRHQAPAGDVHAHRRGSARPDVATPTAWDEQFVHQIPELLTSVARHDPYWRESYFFDIHDPAGEGDVVFFTMAHYPARQRMDSLQMGRVGGTQLIGLKDRPDDGDPHTTALPGVRIEVVEPWEQVRLWADPAECEIGLDLTFTARTLPYGLRRGTMRAGDDVVWDQSHILQSGRYTGTLHRGRHHARGRRLDGPARPLVGHPRPRSLPAVGLVPDPARRRLPRGVALGAPERAHASTPTAAGPAADRQRARSRWSTSTTTCAGSARTARRPTTASTARRSRVSAAPACSRSPTVARITVEAEGTFARPYEPFHRGGLNLMRCRTDDGRSGTAIYEVTGARHHHFFPATTVTGTLPS